MLTLTPSVAVRVSLPVLTNQPFAQHSHVRQCRKVRAIPGQASVACLSPDLLQGVLPPGLIAPMQQECGSCVRKLEGNCFSKPISRPGNQDDLFCQWSHLVLSVSESLLRRRQTESNSSLSLPLTVVQFDQLLDRGGILRLFVSFPEGDQPWKAQSITRLTPDFPRRVHR